MQLECFNHFVFIGAVLGPFITFKLQEIIPWIKFSININTADSIRILIGWDPILCSPQTQFRLCGSKFRIRSIHLPFSWSLIWFCGKFEYWIIDPSVRTSSCSFRSSQEFLVPWKIWFPKITRDTWIQLSYGWFPLPYFEDHTCSLIWSPSKRKISHVNIYEAARLLWSPCNQWFHTFRQHTFHCWTESRKEATLIEIKNVSTVYKVMHSSSLSPQHRFLAHNRVSGYCQLSQTPTHTPTLVLSNTHPNHLGLLSRSLINF